MTSVAVIPPDDNDSVQLGVVHGSVPAELVQRAAEAAKVLASVIEQKGLFSNIQGKRFVRCEGWTTLAAMMGVTPHEISTVEGPEGVFTAIVELRRLSDGQPVARASAECGAPDEVDRHGKGIWSSRPRYARRSMALTRATAKACRLAFSWVMALTGFEVTPAEEIPAEEKKGKPAAGGSAGTKDTAPAVRQPLNEKPAALEVRWPGNGPNGGKFVKDLSTEELVVGLKWAKAKAHFDLVQAIEEELDDRGGEVRAAKAT